MTHTLCSAENWRPPWLIQPTVLDALQGAIEQLQEELAGARQEVEKWRRAAERQGGELVEAQRMVAALEAELEGKAREGAALLADTLELKRRLQDAQDGLHNATDGHAAEATALAGRLKEVERTLAAAQADGKMALAAAATADAATADAKRALAQRADALAAEQQARATLAEQAAALQAELSVAQRQRGELTAAAQELQARLEAAAKQAEARVATEGEARQRAEAATAAAREALADERQRHALEAAAWERRLREAQEGGAARLAAREAAWEAERGKAVKEAAAGEEETRRTLTKRLYLAEGEWAKKLQHASTEWAARLDGLGAEWAARAEADKAAWAAERARLAEEMEARLAEAEAAQEAAVDEARQRGRRKLAAAEARAAEAAVAADRAAAQRLEAALAAAATAHTAAADSLAAAAAQREQALTGQLAAVQESAAARLAELDKQWALKLAAAEEHALRERHELERQWTDKVHAAERAAADAQASLRAQLEGRLAAVSERVGAMLQKEERRERKKAQLMRQVAELEASGEGERGRRRELEAALQEASSIFKRELEDKNQQLELLRGEIKCLRTWAGDGGAVAAAAAAGALDGSAMLLPGRLSAAATVAAMSPRRCPSPGPVASPRCCTTGVHIHAHAFSAPTSPAGANENAAAAAAAAARAVDAEVKALRSAKRAYQRAVLGQQELCTSVARTLNDALRHGSMAGAAAAAEELLRPRSAGNVAIPAVRRKWVQRDLAADWRNSGGCGGGTATEAACDGGTAAAAPSGAAGGAAASSSYDYVKIKVRLGAHLEHYYILSRFLLSRMLTVITLPQHKAVRIALDVKKQLVDTGRLDITQEELEEVLFGLLRQRGYGDEYVRRYQMVTAFFQQKRPLIVLVAGSACTGKSSLAQQLASRLNMPNVLQTDVLYELLRTSGTGDLPAEPLWRRPLPPGASLVGEFQRECATIRRALDGDLNKCIRDGKSIIIEGLHIDPGLFLRECGSPRGDPKLPAEAAAGGLELAGSRGASTGDAAGGGAGGGDVAAAALGSQLQGMQVAAEGDATPASLAAAGSGEARGTAKAAAAAPSVAAQATGAAPAGAAAPASGVRRTASFGDAVPSLSYATLHRQQSPWREASRGKKALLRPRSAQVNSDGLGQRGQAVFMLRSTESADGVASPPPVPSPRLAACISLPAVLEDGPLRQRGAVGPSLAGLAEEAVLCSSGQAAAGVVPVLPLALDGSAGSTQAEQGVTSSLREQQQVVQPPTQAAQDAAGSPAAGSAAAAEATAAAAAGTGPVFVPICLAVPDDQYEGLLPEWLERQLAAGSSSSEGDDDGGGASMAEAGARLRALQAHLRRYAAAGVPVVELDLSDMGAALDSMHTYVLQCIALALGEPDAACD
ncbi:P-loop containing nucleoside triphosphate hydrolases superfamily isoform 1 isoform B [Micractinium conductrix]|uniref:P-loop containing nucleoside triphosphate hydrolases superfamily isoform 1 isoform B n=1 Tax=Micractinium conductrix TaxID=554055 RepID=A0A2P6VAE1_9CHLO|nr:P-loop containing nucleoside triphosphate hydrolases superfamily isoform 1 isoform B [Micractinium conductrix]|eukprot:PSC71060.1 P-loop containing nucleoside triphosphate hydrolases superfamily isoform 1 isoform B [Micractinium conductrix]